MSYLERFENGYIPVTESGCWLWIKAQSTAGYGQIYKEGKVEYAHRLSYEMENGDIPDGMFVCHHCDNPSCVNPNHLFVGTHKDNMRDMFRKKRRPKTVCGETHGMSKLTNEQIIKIRTDNRSQSKIAKDYGIHQTNVSLIKQNKAWTHVGESDD